MSWPTSLTYGQDQRVLNDLQRTRLCRRRLIWLLPHPLPPPVNMLDHAASDTQED
jgi:hypothetical protein